jgi:hypothetical protein
MSIPNPPPPDTIILPPPAGQPTVPPIDRMTDREFEMIAERLYANGPQFQRGFIYERGLLVKWADRVEKWLNRVPNGDYTPRDIVRLLKDYLRTQPKRCDARRGGAGK